MLLHVNTRILHARRPVRALLMSAVARARPASHLVHARRLVPALFESAVARACRPVCWSPSCILKQIVRACTTQYTRRLLCHILNHIIRAAPHVLNIIYITIRKYHTYSLLCLKNYIYNISYPAVYISYQHHVELLYCHQKKSLLYVKQIFFM